MPQASYGAGGLLLRRLGRRDAPAYRQLFQFALLDTPDAFALTPADFAPVTTRAVAQYLAANHVLGLMLTGNNTLLGIGSLNPLPGRLQHMAELSRIYVHPEARGHGAGDGLVLNLLAEATQRSLLGLKLSVAATNHHALALYLRHGFVEYGRLAGEFRASGGLVAGLHMVRRLNN